MLYETTSALKARCFKDTQVPKHADRHLMGFSKVPKQVRCLTSIDFVKSKDPTGCLSIYLGISIALKIYALVLSRICCHQH